MNNSTPIGIIVGPAGSGKDSVAAAAAKYKDIALIAQADPLKQLGLAFGFTEHQLWGPSAARNEPDQRFATADGWNEVAQTLFVKTGAQIWLHSINQDTRTNGNVYQKLESWFLDMARAHGFQLDPEGTGSLGDGRKLVPTLFPETQTVFTPLSARYMLQSLGTEYGREVLYPDIWNALAIQKGVALLEGGYRYDRKVGLVPDKTYAGPEAVWITDGRFRNEVLGVKRAGGYSILVENPAGTETLTAGIANHKSETELKSIPRSWHDVVFLNDKSNGLNALANAAHDLVEWLNGASQSLFQTYAEHLW